MSNALLAQNVIGRLTLGLLGLDLYVQEKRTNQYLDDFLTLSAEEINLAWTSMTPRRLVPECQNSIRDFGLLIQNIEKAKEAIRNLGGDEDPEEIKAIVKRLKKATHLLYSACSH